jgi:hypothetical protein
MSIVSPAKISSAAALALLIFAALGPGKWVPRSGLGWQFDHVAGFLAFTWMLCLAWPRPRVVGAALIVLGLLLEGLQAFTPDRHADLGAALLNAGSALAGALAAELFTLASRMRLGWTVARAHRRLLGLAWNSARLIGTAVLRVVEPASAGLIARRIPVTLGTGTSFRAVSGRALTDRC